ncbi:hypothetical protein T08_1677 [Trichinella sp. T8]|nr:hypothetical protein T08_1677 [Trichinella sp. T8]
MCENGVPDTTTCDRVVLDLPFLRRACRFLVLCLCIQELYLCLAKACLHLFVLLRVTFGNERSSDCG